MITYLYNLILIVYCI